MKEQAALRVMSQEDKRANLRTPHTGLRTIIQTERLVIQGAGVCHAWQSQDGAQFILLGEVIGLRRADGSLSDASMLKLETERFENSQGLLDVEGRFVVVKVLADGACEIWTDRFGRIDIYWQSISSGIVLATGIDLLPVAQTGGRCSAVGMAHALTVYGNRPAKRHTLYAGVNRLGVDQGIRLNGGKVELLSRKFEPIRTAAYGEHQHHQYADILLEAIRARASKDGNVVSLSSGWDSTSILACLVHLFGNRKVRAVIGRMRYAERSGVINQFEIDRAQAFADYFGVRLDIHDLTYFKNGPELLEQAKPLFQAQQFANMSGLNHWNLAEYIAQTANGDEVIFDGEMSDGAHNLGFSQFVTIFHPASHEFREYSDKMASHLFSPTFLRELLEGKHEQDPVWQLFKQRAGNTQFDEPAAEPALRTKQLLASFFLRGGRLPLYSLANSSLLTGGGRAAYAKEMEATYLDQAAREATPETLYAWYLHLYNSFHWQGATIITRAHTALAHGLRYALPFDDSRLIEFLSAMPETWGRGLDLKPTKYPLKWMLQNRIDYPIHFQVGPHSYLYDVDPSFSHMAEILFASAFTPVFKKALASKKFQQWLDPDMFNHGYIDQVVRRYLNNEEFRGAEMNDLTVLAMQAAVGCYDTTCVELPRLRNGREENGQIKAGETLTGRQTKSASALGDKIFKMASHLFPINRSLTGEGVRETLRVIQGLLPALQIHEVPSGTKVYDWVIPNEWNVREAWLEGPDGQRVADFAAHNLHLIGYSLPVDTKVSLEELQDHLHSLPEQPDAIPYVTSYYSPRWGFCLRHKDRLRLKPGTYRAFIDASLEPGSLTYGELILPGQSESEVFLSTYVCHPSMANNELSGPCVTAYLAKWLSELPSRRYSYRIVFVPETIGSITYLSRHLEHLKQRVVAGFNITCVGDERCYSYLPSRAGDTMSDRTALHVLKHLAPGFKRYTFCDRGSDERQYCAPGVDLPIATIMRSKYGVYPEYHTSLDDLTLVTPNGLEGGFNALQKAIEVLENNVWPKSTRIGEPQISRRGLRPTMGTKTSFDEAQRTMMNLWTYSDGKRSLLEIADVIDVPMWDLVPIYHRLKHHGLLEEVETR